MAQQRYHVIERIDAGGMAEVFKANSTSLQGFEKLVAIKRILPNLTKNERFVRMFLDEAKVSLHLNHTNCVQVFDLGLANGTYFIVMEFVDGVNLKSIIEESKRRGSDLPIEQTGYVAMEICKGLAHAHDKRDQEGRHLAIVHRDISPPNILISREGEVKITDFGLAKAKSQAETTDPGIVKGKFGYLSPEAAQGEEVDARTDIFAVGILMWEMLTGERLFLGDTDLETLKQVRAGKIPPLSSYRSDVPPEYEQIVLKALAPNPKRRYQSIRELGRDLAGFLFRHGEPVISFDIAEWVGQVVQVQKAKGERTDRDKAVEEAVQQAVNQIVSLEEVEDLDLYLAQTYDEMDDHGEYDPNATDFEDPRLWADMGMDEMGEMSLREPGAEGGADWQERNLEELMRRKSQIGGDPHASLAADSDPTMEMSDPSHLQDIIQNRQPGQRPAKKGGGRRKEQGQKNQRPRSNQPTGPRRSSENARPQAASQPGRRSQQQKQQSQSQYGKVPIQPGAPGQSPAGGHARETPASAGRASSGKAQLPENPAVAHHPGTDETGEMRPSETREKSSAGIALVLGILVLALVAIGVYFFLGSGQPPG